jgi:hypothetical protein
MNKNLKIALIGNMNNNFFSLHRYLLNNGYDSTLFLFNNELNHFKPINDTWSIEKYHPTIKYLEVGNPFVEIDFRKLKISLSHYNFVFGCGYAPYYFERIGRQLDVFVPYGSDLYELSTNYFNLNVKSGIIPFIKSLYLKCTNYFISRFQRRGIKKSKNIISTDILKTFADANKMLGISFIDCGFPMVYIENDVEKYSLSKEFENQINKVSKFDFVVGSQSRQYWTKVIDSASVDNLKRNDLLINGFAIFLKRTNASACLVLFKYGPDIDSSIQLIKELKIENNVIWFEKSPRKEILYLFKNHVDIGADQFLSGYFGGTGYEILSQGVPLLATIDIDADEYMKQTGKSMPPHINVHSVDEIASSLENYYTYSDELVKLKSDSKQWFDQNLGEGLFKLYENIFLKSYAG